MVCVHGQTLCMTMLSAGAPAQHASSDLKQTGTHAARTIGSDALLSKVASSV